jgi:DNA adenine methylase
MKQVKRLRSPICWFGGKGNMVAKLLPLIPPHHIYCEVFGGGASLLCAKEPSTVEVYNDIDSRLVNLFRVLRDREAFEELRRLVALTLHSREEFKAAKDLPMEGNEVEQAWRFFMLSRQSFSAKLTSWGYGVGSNARGMAKLTSQWIGAIEMLPELHERWMRVQVENDGWQKVLERFDTPETFFYLDPPYVLRTRRGGKVYDHELSDADHKELVDVCLSLQGKVLLSGYGSDLYKPLAEAGWQSMEWRTACHAAGRTRLTGLKGAGAMTARQVRTEVVWMNYKVG